MRGRVEGCSTAFGQAIAAASRTSATLIERMRARSSVILQQVPVSASVRPYAFRLASSEQAGR